MYVIIPKFNWQIRKEYIAIILSSLWKVVIKRKKSMKEYFVIQSLDKLIEKGELILKETQIKYKQLSSLIYVDILFV